MLRPAFLALVLAFGCAAAGAAVPAPAVAEAREEAPGLVGLRVQRLGIEDGLSQATARALAQDADGMLWIGTQDGLNRYDGEEFRVFRRDRDDPRSLADNHITVLTLDRTGRLWVGTQSGGLGRYDADEGNFHNYPVDPTRDDALAAVPVNAIAEAADGRLWVASGRGHLQRLAPATGRFDTIDLPAEVLVRTVLPLPGGDVLLGSSHGLWRWQASDGVLRSWSDIAAGPLLDVQALVQDARGRVWAGSAAHGVFELDTQGRLQRNLRRADGLAGDDVRALLVDEQQRVWVGSYTGLSRIDAPGHAPRTWTREENRRDGLGSERIHALLQDRDGLVWIGSWVGGAYLYLPGSETFREYRRVPGDPRALPGNAVRCVVHEGDGSLWLCVQEGGGLVRFDPARGVLERYHPQADDPSSLASDRVQAVARDPDGSLWVGFVDAGLDRLRPGKNGFEHFRAVPGDPAAPRADNVLALHVDRSGTLWVGYQDGGLDERCAGCDRFRRHAWRSGDPTALPGQTIGAIYESSRNELWVGARPGGLSRLDRASGRFTPIEAMLTGETGLAPRAITAIAENRAGELWVGTQGAGVVRLIPQSGGRYRAITYTFKDGLAAEAIGSLIEDSRGAMWVSTTLGISRIDPASGRIENFSARSGAQADGYFVNAGARLPDGSFAFGGLRGVTVFHPESIAKRGMLHRPVITEVRVFQSRRHDDGPAWRYRHGAGEASDELWLRAGSGGFGFGFSALAFADPELVQYGYRLDPIDRDWIEASATQRNAGYPHLAPGDYTLRIRSRFPGEDYSPERRVAVRLDPLWWQSRWAAAGLLLALLLPFAAWVWNRRQRQLERARAQANLAVSEERLKLALWGTGDEFWDADMRTGSLVRVNPLEHLRVTHEANEHSLRGFTPFVHPEDVAGFGAALSAHVRGESDDFDYTYRSQDVDSRWRWLRSRGRSVERDAQGIALRMAGITEDITDLREYERTLERVNQQLEERVGERTADLMMLNRELVKTIDELKLAQHQLVESEKLAALGGLVAGIAHEVNTPLGVGVTAASHLEQQARLFTARLESGTPSAQEVESFRSAVLDCSSMVLRNLQRADKMIRSFKQVAVDQASEQPRRIDLRAYIDEILVSLQPTLKRCRQRLVVEVPERMVVLLMPGALYQILVNLIMNSITHAFPNREDGEIRIAARREGDTLVLEYGDDGCGMSEEVRRHMFEPFFTTRRGQGGSGLGMHIVYTLAVQALGGTIECDTAPGKGTRFTLRIPVKEAVGA
jgi:ligand-binding sensor domain-containing protein/signal transduction histidine kinase